MKTILALTTVAVVAATGASAMSNPAAGLEGFVSPEVAAQLDARTLASIKNVIHSGDTRSERAAVIDSLVRQAK